MADFSSVVELSINVPRSEIRGAKQAIESGIGSASVATDGGAASRATGGGGRQGRRMFRWARQRTTYLETMVGTLDSIEDKIGGGGMGGGGGGGGIGSGLVSLGRTALTATGAFSIGSILSGMSASSLLALIGTAPISSIVVGTIGTAALLDYFGVIDINDIVTGSIERGKVQIDENVRENEQVDMLPGNEQSWWKEEPEWFTTFKQTPAWHENAPQWLKDLTGSAGSAEADTQGAPGVNLVTGFSRPNADTGGAPGVNLQQGFRGAEGYNIDNRGDVNVNVDANPSEIVDQATKAVEDAVQGDIDDLERRIERAISGQAGVL